jgi:hypothetical protein
MHDLGINFDDYGRNEAARIREHDASRAAIDRAVQGVACRVGRDEQIAVRCYRSWKLGGVGVLCCEVKIKQQQ